MSATYIFGKVSDLKEKFKKFFVIKKKVRALENFSECAPFEHREYLHLIQKCVNDGFPGEKEADFLDYMLERYEVNFLDWFHRTPWLKAKMATMSQQNKKPPAEQMFFGFMQPKPSYVPVEILGAQTTTSQGRHV